MGQNFPIPGYRASFGPSCISAPLIRRLAEAGLLYVTTTQTRGQLIRRLLQADWSSKPQVISLVIWSIQGQLTGHEWQACLTCHQVRLTTVGKHRCKMTPGCKGRLERIAERPILTAQLRQILRLGTNVNL